MKGTFKIKKWTRYLCYFLFLLCSLFSCEKNPQTTYFPNMKAYSDEEVLEVAKRKYDIEQILVEAKPLYSLTGKILDGIPFEIREADNVLQALSSFAGRNGDQQVQNAYRYFVGYFAVAMTKTGKAKFIFYNTHIDKKVSISSTIGSSAYTLSVLPHEVNLQVFDSVTDENVKRDLRYFLSATTMADFSYSHQLYVRIEGSMIPFSYGYTKGRLVFYKSEGTLYFDWMESSSGSLHYFYSSNPRITSQSYDKEQMEPYFTSSLTFTDDTSAYFQLLPTPLFLAEVQKIQYAYLRMTFSYTDKQGEQQIREMISKNIFPFHMTLSFATLDTEKTIFNFQLVTLRAYICTTL